MKGAQVNVIFVMIDTLRADYLGCYGNSWVKTPNMDALAKESVVFDRAYPESCPTLPVRRSVFSMTRCFPFVDWHTPKGTYPVIPGWQGLREEDVTFPELMTLAGYRTAMFADTYHMAKPGMNFHRFFSVFRWIRGQEADRYGYGELLPDCMVEKYFRPAQPDEKAPRKMQGIKNYLRNSGNRRSEEDYFAPKVFGQAIHFLENEYNRGPFLLYIDSFDPHEPWDPPQWYLDMYDPDYEGVERIWPNTADASIYTESELRHIKSLYASEVTMVDTWFGKLMDKVKQLGILDDTLVVFIADHGTELAEHGRIGKSTKPYQHNIQLPAMIRFPDGTAAGKRIDSLVMNYDFSHTMLSCLGLHAPEGADSVDLMPLIKGETDQVRDHIINAWGPSVGIIEGAWSLNCTDERQPITLFNLEEDPEEQKDVKDQAPEKAKDLIKRLEQLYEDRGLKDYSLAKRRQEVVAQSAPAKTVVI